LILPLYRAQNFRGVVVGCIPWSGMESLLHSDDVRSGRTIDATKVRYQKVYNFLSDCGIAPKLLEEFSQAVFLGVAWNRYCMQTTSVGAYHQRDQSIGSTGL